VLGQVVGIGTGSGCLGQMVTRLLFMDDHSARGGTKDSGWGNE
jgi:hypothetical protein